MLDLNIVLLYNYGNQIKGCVASSDQRERDYYSKNLSISRRKEDHSIWVPSINTCFLCPAQAREG